MKISDLVGIAFRYDALFTRYARMLTRSSHAATVITMAVFEDYYNSDIELDDKALRYYLRWAVKERCIEWRLANANWQ